MMEEGSRLAEAVLLEYAEFIAFPVNTPLPSLPFDGPGLSLSRETLTHFSPASELPRLFQSQLSAFCAVSDRNHSRHHSNQWDRTA